MLGKIDIHDSKKALEAAQRKLSTLPINLHNKKAIDDFLHYAELGKIGRGARERKLTKYIYVLTTVNEQLGNRPFEEISEQEYEDWFKNLRNGTIASKKRQGYSDQTKRDLIKDFKIFMSWYEKGHHHYKVKWFKINRERNTPPAFTMQQMREIIEQEQELEVKFYLALAMDSGARPEELFNCRKKDFRWVERPDAPGESCYWLNIRYSKNDQMPRDVPCPNFTTIYNEYVAKYWTTLHEDDSVLTYGYRTYFRRLKEIQQRIIQPITHYKIRHSSWTYWGAIIHDKYKLNKRMGEKLTSVMADTYINDDIMDSQFRESITAGRKDQVSVLQREVEELRTLVQEQRKAEQLINDFMSNPAVQQLFKTMHKMKRISAAEDPQ